MFELVPFNVAVIDRDFNVVAANRNFEEYFGDWRNRRCYEVFKQLSRALRPVPSDGDLRGRARARVR